jgi:D-alanyl-D-alanine endopeptidase (penicillin-binding protein 7)
MQVGRFLLCVIGAVAMTALPEAGFASGTSHVKHGEAAANSEKSPRHTKLAKAEITGKQVAVKASKAKPKATLQPVTVHRAKKVQDEEADFDASGAPLIRSSAFYVQDVSSGQVLLEKNSTAVQPIASITKLMTTMVVLDANQNLNEVLEVMDEDIDRLKGSSSHLTVGSRLTREELIHLALMASENRAASALARNYPGGMPAFLEAMNAKARLLGLMGTHFFDGTGLTKNNVSSARDLAIMVATASRYPLIREFSTSTEYTATLVGGRNFTFHNTNALVKSPEWQIDVSKTGYINESGKCLVMQAWFGNKQLAIVLLDSWGRFTRLGDANRIKRWLEASAGRRSVAVVHHQSTATNL